MSFFSGASALLPMSRAGMFPRGFPVCLEIDIESLTIFHLEYGQIVSKADTALHFGPEYGIVWRKFPLDPVDGQGNGKDWI